MNPIDFEGQRLLDLHSTCNNFVNTIESEPLCASSSNLAYMLIMLRERTLKSCEVKGQGHYGLV